MKTKLLIISALLILLTGCAINKFTAQEPEAKTISRDEAEAKALQFLYQHTTNKEIYERELIVKNYIFDSWKEENVWHVIAFLGNTFIEILVYDDGSDQIKVLQKTDYWSKVPRDVKAKMLQNANNNTG